jgi:hypothetical protein
MSMIMNVNDQLDMTAPEVVQIQVDASGETVWINVDGVCRLRCCRVGQIEIEDNRRDE